MFYIRYVNHSDDNITLVFVSLPKIKWYLKSFMKIEYVSLMVEQKHNNIVNKYFEMLN